MVLRVLSMLALVLVMMSVSVTEAFPRNFFRSQRSIDGRRSTVATVDCSNREAVEYVMSTHANFRCVYPNSNSQNSYRVPEQPLFPSSLRSDSLIREQRKRCDRGFIYSSEVNMCLLARRPLQRTPLRSDNLVLETDQVLEIQSFANAPKKAGTCDPGQIYLSELGICSDISSRSQQRFQRPVPALNLVRDRVSPLEITAFSSSQMPVDCKTNQIYNSEISRCVDIGRRIRPSALRTGNLVKRDTFIPNPTQQIPSDCDEDKGEYYQSEIGICIVDPNPSDWKPDSASLVRDKTPEKVQPRPVAYQDKVECPGGFFNPSLGICLPALQSSVADLPPPSSSLVKEPEALEITAFGGSVTESYCNKLNKIFVAELGLCM